MHKGHLAAHGELTDRLQIEEPETKTVLRVVACLATVAIVVPASATADPALGVPSFERSALVRLGLASELLTSSSIGRDVRLAARLDGVRLRAVAAPARSIAGLPSPLGAPLARLLEVVSAAESLTAQAVRVRPASFDRLLSRAERVVRRGNLHPSTAVQAAASQLGSDTRRSVDQAALFSAAVAIADALDASIPALEIYAASRPEAPAATGCDLVDAIPVLCVGDTGPNTYTQDVALQVDLGGDDRYENSAGGADPVPILGNGIPVSVAVDLAGNDTYHASFPLAGKSRVAQGAGAVGGVGFLVDMAGDDRYQQTGKDPRGQGMGYGGVGVLYDAAGSDGYAIRASAPVASSAYGQGQTLLGALGLLVDRGASDDSYLLESLSAPSKLPDGRTSSGSVEADGQGSAYDAGVAVLADDGGSSSMEARGIVAPIDPTDRSFQTLSVGKSYAQGSSVIAGTGLALSGPGDTTWSSTIEIGGADAISLQGSSGVWSQGSANLGALAGLVDLGGDDTYFTSAASRIERRAVTDPSETEPAVTAYAPDLYDMSQGLGYLGGTGVLRDAAGSDTYTARSRTDAVAEIRDTRRGFLDEGESEASAEADALLARTYAQGVGYEGSGVLFDHEGDDRYSADATSRATATATATDGARTPVATASPGAATTWAQGASYGAGHGEMIDAGGSDQYRSVNTSVGTVLPAGETELGDAHASVQGAAVAESPYTAGTATLWDLGAGTDTFASVPEDPACTGTRGQSYWVDCSPALGVGYNQG